MTAYESVADEVIAVVRKFISLIPTEVTPEDSFSHLGEILVTGHSLGGALANLAAADIREKFPEFRKPMKLFTFGAPRVGNQQFARMMNTYYPEGNNFRVVNKRDIVPHIPTRVINKFYYHNGDEVWYNVSQNVTNSQTGKAGISEY